jgi:chromosome segregation ATPase
MKSFLIAIMSFVSIAIYGNTSDSMRIVKLQAEVVNLKSILSSLQQENSKLYYRYQMQATELDSLKYIQNQQAGNMAELANKMGADLTKANKKIDDNVGTLSDSISLRTWLAVCGIIIAMALLGVVYFILRKNILSGSSSIDKIKAAQEGLETAQKAMQEESVKLDGKLVELLESYLKQSPTQEQDHSLILSIATEVARIEQNIAFMDTKVKGVSNLKNRASAINATLKAKGYEIPRLVGEKYHDGDNMVPTMELDEELPVGTQIIRRVLKPMVLYNGKMIQAAHVVVAFNE